MGTKYYKSISDLKEVDEVLRLTDSVLGAQHAVIKVSSATPKIVAASFTAVAGTGAAMAAGSGAIGAGVAGASVAGLGAGAMGAAGVVGGIALAPIAIPAALLGGIGYLLFKNKKAKELNTALQFKLKKAMEKQNQIIKQYNDILKAQKAAMEKKAADYEEIIKQQAQKIDELLAISKSLELVISKMTEQLTA